MAAAGLLLYDGTISGALIATDIAGYSGANLIVIPSANGLNVTVIGVSV